MSYYSGLVLDLLVKAVIIFAEFAVRWKHKSFNTFTQLVG
jgi:hypothetical protein